MQCIQPCIYFYIHVVRSSHRRCSVKKGVLKNSINFERKHLRFHRKNTFAFNPETLFKKILRRRCFSVNIAKIVKIGGSV